MQRAFVKWVMGRQCNWKDISGENIKCARIYTKQVGLCSVGKRKSLMGFNEAWWRDIILHMDVAV